MIEPQGIQVLLDTVKMAPKEGIIVIAGTAHGGDAMAIMKKFPDRYLVVVDSFQGVAAPVKKDGPNAPKKGAHNAHGLDRYKANFKDLKRPLPHEIFKMWITKKNLKIIGKRKVAMLFMDLDHYTPVKACLKTFMPMMVPDGQILTHDWKFILTQGVEKACEEIAPGCWETIRGFGRYKGHK